MATATVNEVVHKTVSLELSYEEACLLLKILGISKQDASMGTGTWDVYQALAVEGVTTDGLYWRTKPEVHMTADREKSYTYDEEKRNR